MKPFVKSNKNDFVDAEAIAEAVDRKNMRFAPIKTDDPLNLQADRLIRMDTRAPHHGQERRSPLKDICADLSSQSISAYSRAADHTLWEVMPNRSWI